MRLSRSLVAGAAIAVSLTASPAGAAYPVVPVDFTPTEGLPGTVVTVSGNCALDFEVGTVEGDEWDIDATATSPDGGTTVEGSDSVGTADGDWSIDLTIPESAVPGDEWDIDAYCTYIQVTAAPLSVVENQRQQIPYETGQFLVTQAPTTTTTEASTTTTTEATTTTAAAAPAVAAAPSFTG